jgi:hypothetical protein
MPSLPTTFATFSQSYALVSTFLLQRSFSSNFLPGSSWQRSVCDFPSQFIDSLLVSPKLKASPSTNFSALPLPRNLLPS